jgi:hypothetical protein
MFEVLIVLVYCRWEGRGQRLLKCKDEQYGCHATKYRVFEIYIYVEKCSILKIRKNCDVTLQRRN